MTADDRWGATAACVATRDELVRTALRVLLLVVYSGLYPLPQRVRQSLEARRANEAINAASDFFNRNYDAARLAGELDRLCAGLTPLARAGYDPFRLFVLRERKRSTRRAPNVVPFRRPGA